MNSTSHPSNPSSLKQAAVVIKSLPQWQAASLLSRMRAADCARLLEVVTELDSVTAEQLSATLQKFRQDSERLRSESATPTNDESFVERRKQAGTIFDRAGKPFDFLVNTLPEVRKQVLENEHPQNIAIVLSSLPPEIASSCLAALDASVKVSVVRRLCELEELDRKEVNELSYVLKLRHQKLYRRITRKSAGVKVAVDLLSCSDPETQRLVLGLLEQTEPELAQELENACFSMDDLLEMTDDEIKSLLAKVDTSQWAPALKECSFAVQTRILSNMAPTPSKILGQEIANAHKVDSITSQLAQRQIIKEAIKLHAK